MMWLIHEDIQYINEYAVLLRIKAYTLFSIMLIILDNKDDILVFARIGLASFAM